MSVEITHVHYEDNGNPTHETIDAYQYRYDGQSEAYYRRKPSMVSFLEGGETAHVGNGTNWVPVGIVNSPPIAKYLRTHADGKYSNNLLSLPTFTLPG